jgi:peptidoglycan hydrolase-like protein with peptidoglycan-binding domain
LRARTGAALVHARALLGVVSAGKEFDAATAAAVKMFQTRNALDVDGEIGPDTWSHLRPTLRQGDSGEGVSELQDALDLGSFDAATDAAVRARQSAFVLTNDGSWVP